MMTLRRINTFLWTGGISFFIGIWIILLNGGWAWGGKDVIEIGQVKYVSLSALAKEIGFKYQRLEPLKKVALVGKTGKAVFEIHKREVFINNRRVYLGAPVSLCSNQLYVSQLDVKKTIKPLLVPQLLKISWPKAPKRIVIDPGHGGSDPGAQHKGYGLFEKNLALDLALKLKAQLQSKGFEVFLTRESDIKLSLQERPQIAKRFQADLFISLHFNAASAKDVMGIETYVLTPVGQPSTGRGHLETDDLQMMTGHDWDIPNICLGYAIQAALSDQVKGEDRGVKRARFAVLKSLECPGVLLECGFLSNDQEANRLKQAAYRDLLATAIATGILSYINGLSLNK